MQMEPYDRPRARRFSSKSRDYDESSDNELRSKMTELTKTKEELAKAKESTMQAWIDSRPLIDELERLKSGLAGAENRSIMPNAIPNLESQLQTTNMSIRSKKEEEHKAKKMTNELNKALEQARQEIGRFKSDIEEVRQAKPRLKQTLHLRSQTLQTRQLGLRAVQIEREALVASKAKAVHYLNCSEMEINPIHLSLEDYHTLTKRADDENSLSEWRVSVAREQKLATEASRNKSLEQLNRLLAQKRSRGREIKEEIISEDGQNEDPSMRGQEHARQNMLPQSRSRAIAHPNQRNPRSSNSKKLSTKTKTSVVQKISHFFVSKIKGLFQFKKKR